MKEIIKSIAEFFKKYFRKYPIYKLMDTPVVIKYDNESEEVKQGVLFGFNYHNSDNNFGNGDLVLTDLTDESIKGNIKILFDKHRLSIAKFRIMFPSDDKQFYLTNRIMLRHEDANGKKYAVSHVPLNSMDSYQNQSEIIDINRFNFNGIDSNTIFEFSVKNKSFIVISVYLQQKLMLGYFEYKKIKKKEQEMKINKALVVQQIMPKFSFISYIKGLFNMKSYTNINP